MMPSFIQDIIPPLVCEISDYPLRNNRNISVPLYQTSILQKYCIPSAIRLWNSLDDNLKNIPTLPTFKKHITSKLSIAHVPPYLAIWNRYMSVLHVRLRNKCSGLNSDLFRNHIRNNPLCDLLKCYRMPTTTSCNVKNILLKDRCSMIQLEIFIILT